MIRREGKEGEAAAAEEEGGGGRGGAGKAKRTGQWLQILQIEKSWRKAVIINLQM